MVMHVTTCSCWVSAHAAHTHRIHARVGVHSWVSTICSRTVVHSWISTHAAHAHRIHARVCVHSWVSTICSWIVVHSWISTHAAHAHRIHAWVMVVVMMMHVVRTGHSALPYGVVAVRRHALGT